MKKYIITALISCSVFIILCSVGVDKMFILRQSTKGVLVYVMEQKMNCLKTGNKVKSIKYDYTYLQNPDSVTFLSTILLPSSQSPVSITFKNENIDYTEPVDLIFVKSKGKNFQYRLQIKLPYSLWKELYSNSSPFTIRYTFASEGAEVFYDFGYKEKKWQENREKINHIINIINLNTQ